MTAVTNQAINKLLARGVRNLWYPICPSHFLGEKPISLRRLGLKVVLWRDEAGSSVMLEDHCPHRGAAANPSRRNPNRSSRWCMRPTIPGPNRSRPTMAAHESKRTTAAGGRCSARELASARCACIITHEL